MKRYISCAEQIFFNLDELWGNFDVPIPGNQTRSSRYYQSAYQEIQDNANVSKYTKLESEVAKKLLHTADWLEHNISTKIDDFYYKDMKDSIDKQIDESSKELDKLYETYIGLTESMIDKINNEQQNSASSSNFKYDRLKDEVIHRFRATMVTDEIRILLNSKYYKFPN